MTELQEKQTSKRKLSTMLLACVIISALAVGTVAAVAVWLYSNPVTVVVNPVANVYSLHLSVTPSTIIVGEQITFTGSLTTTGTGSVAGATIVVFSDISGQTSVASAVTASDGTFTCTYTPTTARTYQFNAATDTSLLAP